MATELAGTTAADWASTLLTQLIHVVSPLLSLNEPRELACYVDVPTHPSSIHNALLALMTHSLPDGYRSTLEYPNQDMASLATPVLAPFMACSYCSKRIAKKGQVSKTGTT